MAATSLVIICVMKNECLKHNQKMTRSFATLTSETFKDLEDQHACPEKSECQFALAENQHGPWTSLANTDPMYRSPIITVAASFGVKFIRITCVPELDSPTCSMPAPTEPEKKDAFAILMSSGSRGKSLPSVKTSSSGVKDGLSRKDELYNDIIKLLRQNHQSFYNCDVEGKYIIQTLTNALWYSTNQHQVIYDTSLRQSMVTSVPPAFDCFQGYNDSRRKKLKSNPMESGQLKSHSEALYSLCTRPSLSTPDTAFIYDQIKALADCFKSYSLYLDQKNKDVSANQARDQPVRIVSDNTTVRSVPKSLHAVRLEYRHLEEALSTAQPLEPVFFDEDIHLEKPFPNANQRLRFIEKLQLSVPIDAYKYCPGGNLYTVHCFVKVTENRTAEQSRADVVSVMAKLQPSLPVYHTRLMKRQFKMKLNNLAAVQPAVADIIYKELSLDSATVSHPDTAQGMKMIFLGETGLIADMRQLNAGRPTGIFDDFFSKLGEVIEEVTAADERRQNVAHLSQWLSLKDMIQQAKDCCEVDTPTPSPELVRLQFTPRNPYVHSALNFTSKFAVQYKIQRRQLRVSHMDMHYCAAQLKYMREYAVLLKEQEDCMLFFCDDKAKVHIGEPGVQIATGVRGKKSLAPSTTTLAAADHDLHHKCSLTPSVYLKCLIPDNDQQSFYSGTVTVTVNDSVFQSSDPFRHALTLVKQVRKSEVLPKVIMKFTDGGTDHRNTLEAVKCASICTFKELDLDLLIAARCAPGQSWVNPAERVMSVLNIGLQNCALERRACAEDIEKALKKCSGMSDIRNLGARNSDIKAAWAESIEESKAAIENRFRRLSLKGEPMQVIDPMLSGEVDDLKRHLNLLFPELDPEKLVKTHTRKVSTYNDWLGTHCIQHTYCFQIRKCQDPECCPPLRSAHMPAFLPDPTLDDTKEHFLPLQEVLGKDTTEADRPSFILTEEVKEKSTKGKGKASAKMPAKKVAQAPATSKKQHVTVTDEDTDTGSSIPLTAQTARLLIECVECQKQRVVYSKNKLSERQKTMFAMLLSEFDYTCGSHVTAPDHSLHGKTVVRMSLNCQSPMEVAFYSSELTNLNICYYCGGEEGETDMSLKENFKTVFPICAACTSEGYNPCCMRPYGK